MNNLQLHSLNTPNGLKVVIALAEIGVDYDYHQIDISKGEQFTEEFLQISPNNKIPALIDLQGPGGKKFSLFESGAILIYLAEKFDSPLLPKDAEFRYNTLVWLMFQMGGVGPMFGQANHFINTAPEKIPYAIERYTKEEQRICKVMDKRLSQVTYLAGDSYTLADIACFPWLEPYERNLGLSEYQHLSIWYKHILERPTVSKIFQGLNN